MTRVLTRVVTPGMPWDADGTDSRGSCWIAALCGTRKHWRRFSGYKNGALRVTEVEGPLEAWEEIKRIGASEVIVDARLLANEIIHADLQRMSHSAKGADFLRYPSWSNGIKKQLNG